MVGREGGREGGWEGGWEGGEGFVEWCPGDGRGLVKEGRKLPKYRF